MNSLKVFALATALVAGARALNAQAVVQPDPILDSTQSVIQRSVHALRDSLAFVQAASARIARDMRTTSDAVLRARAREMARGCAAASRSTTATRAVVVGAKRPEPDPRKLRPGMEQALDELKGQLDRCVVEFRGLATPLKAQELRDYGIGRGQKVEQAIRRYELGVRSYFFGATGVRYMPGQRGRETGVVSN